MELVLVTTILFVVTLIVLHRRGKLPRLVKKYTFEEQWDCFQSLGFKLNEGVTLKDIDRWNANAHKSADFSLMYTTLGQTLERSPWTPLTNNVWSFDTEAIHIEGDYSAIINNLGRISRNELPFENVSDTLNRETSTASLSFTLNGENYAFTLKLNDDWIDEELFSEVVKLTQTHHTQGRFTLLDRKEGQDMVIGYMTEKDLASLIKTTGLNIVWLK